MNNNQKLPIASNWFEVEPIDEHGIRRINETHVNEYGGGNIWLVEGSECCLLVDTGVGVAPLRHYLESITSKPIIAFASVGYYDHAGGLHQFDERLIHSAEVHRISQPTRDNTVAQYYMGGAFTARPDASFDSSTYLMTASQPTRLLTDGDIIRLGNRAFEVLHLPGITAGACALFESSSGVLFTGEALVWSGNYVYDGEPVVRCDHADNIAFRKSIQRLRDLPAKTVYPGHYARSDADAMKVVIDAYLQGQTICR